MGSIFPSIPCISVLASAPVKGRLCIYLTAGNGLANTGRDMKEKVRIIVRMHLILVGNVIERV